MSNLLPGIHKIETAPANTATFEPVSAFINRCFDNLTINAPFVEVPIVQLAKLTEECKTENGQDVYQITLTYITSERPTNYSPSIFRVTDTNDKQFLIGTNETPHPTVTWKYDIPDTPNAQRAYAVTVSWKTTIGIVVLPMAYPCSAV